MLLGMSGNSRTEYPCMENKGQMLTIVDITRPNNSQHYLIKAIDRPLYVRKNDMVDWKLPFRNIISLKLVLMTK